MAHSILITGGAGFIGSHLAEDALAHGDRVVILDNLSTGKRENIPPGATFYHRDLSEPGLDELVADEKIDVVSHHAAQVNVRISIADPTADARTNILATLDLIAACKKSGVRRLLFASSGGTVYGEQRVYPCDETHSTHPTSPYGCAKLAVELYLDAFRVMGDLDPIVFRYANIYGPRQEPKGEAGIVAILAEKLLAGETPRIFDDGEQTRDYVFVGDLVRAHRAALENWRPGIYNVGTGTETSVNRLYEMVSKHLKSDLRPRHEPPVSAELRRNSLDASRLEAALGAAPKTALVDGLAQTLPYYQARAATTRSVR